MPQYDAMGNATGFTEEIPETPPKVEEKKDDKKECETCKDGEWTDKDGKKHKVETLPDGTKMETITSPDGSTTTITTSPDGSVQTVSTGADGKTGTSTVQNRDGSKEVTEYKGDGQYEQKSYNAKGEVVASNTRGEDGATVTSTTRTNSDGSTTTNERVQGTNGRVYTNDTTKSEGWFYSESSQRETVTTPEGGKMYDATTNKSEYGIKDVATVGGTTYSGDRVGMKLEGQVGSGEIAEIKGGGSVQYYGGKVVGGDLYADQSVFKGGLERVGAGGGAIMDPRTGGMTYSAQGRIEGFAAGAGAGGSFSTINDLNGNRIGYGGTAFAEGPFGAGVEGALKNTNGSWSGGAGLYAPIVGADNDTYGTGGGLMGVNGTERLSPQMY